MIIDCVSDLHGCEPKLPGGDVLILAGDLTAGDKVVQWNGFFAWLKAQDYRKKLYIAGNHDNLLYETIADSTAKDMGIIECMESLDAIYLRDSGYEFEGLKFWGSPWTQLFAGQNPICKAFGLPDDTQLGDKWALIPHDTDVLITHSPPKDVLDKTWRRRVGSQTLRNEVLGPRLEKLKLHVFGHIHEPGGEMVEIKGRKFVNAAVLDSNYIEREQGFVRVVL